MVPTVNAEQRQVLLLLLRKLQSSSNEIMRSIALRRRALEQRLRHRRRNRLRLLQSLLTVPPFVPPVHSERKLWIKARSKHWWEVTVLTEFNDMDWLEHFRMTRATFELLCELLGDSISPSESSVREPIPLNKRVAVGLYKLANCCDYRLVANLFGIHKSSVHNCIYSLCQALAEMSETFIKLPNENEANEIAREIQYGYGFPQVFGAVSVTHIPITAPKERYTSYVNANGWTSYILQGVVDNRYMFRSISCRTPGSVTNSIVLKESSLFSNSKMIPKSFVRIENENVPLMILGDGSHPLLPWLTKSHGGPALTKEQLIYNSHVRAVRTLIETAFDRLKSRWRILLKRMEIQYEFVPTVIVACCVLHNFCEREQQDYDCDWEQQVSVANLIYPQPNDNESIVDTSESKAYDRVRNAICAHLARIQPNIRK